ncbi:MAG: ABC transporter ATP-binding protein [Oligoflexia bacterium]|nr:ABC transporter ATP-binding protein [Oligoflexia bacterium]
MDVNKLIVPDNSKFFLKICKYYIWRFRRQFGWGVLAIVLINALDVLPPIILKDIIDGTKSGKFTLPLPYLSLALAIIYVCMGGLRFAWRFFFMITARKIDVDLKKNIFEKILKGNYRDVSALTPGSVVSFLGQDIENFRMFIGPGVLIFFDMISYLVYVPCMLFYILGWSGGWLLLVFIFLPMVMPTYERVMNLLYGDSSKILGKMSDAVYENSVGMKIFKVLSMLEIRTSKFDLLLQDLYEKRLKISKVDILLDTFVSVLSLLSMAVLFLLAYFALNPNNQNLRAFTALGTIVLVLKLLEKIIWPMMAFAYFANLLERAKSSIQRLQPLYELRSLNCGLTRMSAETSAETGVSPDYAFDIESIKVRGLYFGPLINISFNASKGEKIALVGDVGAGKSTLLRVLATLYQYSDFKEVSEFYYNSTPYSELDLWSVRSKIAYIPQDAMVFNNTILKNVDPGYSPDVSRICWSLKMVNLHHELEQFPQGIHTMVGEKGVTLSGGQKQRLAIARSFYSGARLHLWDDTISALDVDTEEKLIKSIIEINSESILILATHRLSTLTKFDRIYVMKEGNVAEVGDYWSLIEAKGEFYRLYLFQEKILDLAQERQKYEYEQPIFVT